MINKPHIEKTKFSPIQKLYKRPAITMSEKYHRVNQLLRSEEFQDIFN